MKNTMINNMQQTTRIVFLVLAGLFFGAAMQKILTVYQTGEKVETELAKTEARNTNQKAEFGEVIIYTGYVYANVDQWQTIVEKIPSDVVECTAKNTKVYYSSSLTSAAGISSKSFHRLLKKETNTTVEFKFQDEPDKYNDNRGFFEVSCKVIPKGTDKTKAYKRVIQQETGWINL